MEKFTPSEEDIKAKLAASLGQLTREQAIEILTTQHEHDAALEAAEKKKTKGKDK